MAGRLAPGVLVAISLAVAAMVVAPLASAADPIRTEVEIRYEGAFEGTVKAAKPKCEVRRRVGLYEIRSGETKRLATDKTSREDPNVSFPGVMPKPNRRYFLRVDRRERRSYTCARAKSERLAVE
ncbi:hypothetical protein HJD18_12255 [Thermoleophilia bacterium SCSIO 60948]|nr:hypothetical protein HJD18_12255 [Thermoleophilia bacterium SCSIO 60948]